MSRLNTTWKWIVATAAVFVPAASMAVTIPHDFTAGTPIVAAEVNANFAELETAVTSVENGKADAPAVGVLAPIDKGRVAYVRAGPCHSSAVVDCEPPPDKTFTTASISPTITRTAVGRYSVKVPGIIIGTGVGGHAQVSAKGTNANYCKLVNTTTELVTVSCFDPTGAASDSDFSLLVLN